MLERTKRCLKSRQRLVIKLLFTNNFLFSRVIWERITKYIIVFLLKGNLFQNKKKKSNVLQSHSNICLFQVLLQQDFIVHPHFVQVSFYWGMPRYASCYCFHQLVLFIDIISPVSFKHGLSMKIFSCDFLGTFYTIIIVFSANIVFYEYMNLGKVIALYFWQFSASSFHIQDILSIFLKISVLGNLDMILKVSF